MSYLIFFFLNEAPSDATQFDRSSSFLLISRKSGKKKRKEAGKGGVLLFVHSMYKEPNYKSKAWLTKYGWQKGQGLGKNGDGMTDFLRVAVKTDTQGLGTEILSPDEQFRGGFGWWDQVYNRAASGIKVKVSDSNEEKDDDGVQVQVAASTTKNSSNISSTNSTSSELLAKFYGGAFVKASSSLEDNKEENEDEGGSSDKKLGSLPLDDAAVFEACGKRTLSKYKYLPGKTKRAAEQERQWNQTTIDGNGTTTDYNEKNETIKNDGIKERKKKKKKKNGKDMDQPNRGDAKLLEDRKRKRGIEGAEAKKEKKKTKGKKEGGRKKEKQEEEEEKKKGGSLEEECDRPETEPIHSQETKKKRRKKKKQKIKKKKKEE